NGNVVLTSLGFAGALLHTLNHSLIKSLLFFNAGSVYQQTHIRDMEKLGGLIHAMPQTTILFLAGGMAIGGLPPFNGFISEFILYSGILDGIKSVSVSHITLMLTSLSGLALIGGLSMLTFTKNFGTIFLGSTRTYLHQSPREVSVVMRVPQYFILTIMLSIGLFPQFIFPFVNKITIDFVPGASVNSIPGSLIHSLSAIGKISFLFMLLLMLIYFVRRSISQKRPSSANATWGCGYVAPTVKMQYTGKSFSKSLGKLLNFIVLEKKKYKEIQPGEIFPAERKHSSHYNDFFVTRIFDGVIDRLLYSLNYFQFIQNGKIQLYILYGIFFIVMVFLGTVFKII
ncbi:MAG TPA: proton-conducting transporter membrane subunit, partial [Chitinophagaceae bacterium]|nr:proton-conducting transporter membrane subunit [Chitinophagaceae bacterium]